MRVAVVDTGLDLAHPVFADRIDQRTSETFTFDSTLQDYHGHGTHVSGIIGGAGVVNPKYAGIAPGVELIICKISSGSTFAHRAAAAIEHAVNNGADLINLSLGEYDHVAGGPGPWIWPKSHSPLEDAVQWATEHGALCVCAAGNYGPASGSVEPPGVIKDALSVGATNWEGLIADCSGRGPFCRSDILGIGEVVRAEKRPDIEGKPGPIKPDLVAPGGAPCSPWVPDLFGRIQVDPDGIAAPRSGTSDRRPASALDVDQRYTRMSGTSQATAVVTGLAALAMEFAVREGLEWGKKSSRASAVANLLRRSASRDQTEPIEAYGQGRLAWPRIRDLVVECANDDDHRHAVLGGGELRLM